MALCSITLHLSLSGLAEIYTRVSLKSSPHVRLHVRIVSTSRRRAPVTVLYKAHRFADSACFLLLQTRQSGVSGTERTCLRSSTPTWGRSLWRWRSSGRLSPLFPRSQAGQSARHLPHAAGLFRSPSRPLWQGGRSR